MNKSLECVAMPQVLTKLVERVKEIVDCSEAEIYETLKDCDMEPNEAVSRLLTQDHFQKVKRKPEKKKEVKDHEITSNGSSRRIKSRADRYVDRGGSSSITYSSAPNSMQGRLTYWKESEPTGCTGNRSPVSDVPGNNKSNGPSAHSNGYAAEKEVPSVKADRMTSVIQSSSLAGVSGQRSMADIVKRRRVKPHSKTLNGPTASYQVARDTSELASNNNDNICSDEDQALKIHHNRVPTFQHASSTSCNWPRLEKTAAGEIISVPECAVERKCTLPLNNSDEHSEAAKSRELGVPISVVTEDLHRLSLPEDGRELPSNEDVPSVKFPDNLPVQTADCSHLSFGRFQSSKMSTYSPGIEISVPIQNSLEADPSIYGDTSSADHADISRHKLHTDDLVRNASNGGLFHGAVGPELEEAKLTNRFYFPSSSHDHSSDNYRSAFNPNSSHMQNLAQLSNLMQSRTDFTPSALLAANSQLSREPDSQYIPFPTTPSMSTKYRNALPAIGEEALKAGGLISTTDCASGPQQLALQSFGAYPDMIDYSAYMPSAFRQTSAGNGNSLNYQSLAALIPQYKSSGVSANSLPLPISRQGVLGNAASTHGKYSMDLPTSILHGDGDVLSSWYNSNRQSISHQQNGNSLNWDRGYNSRTVPSTAYHEAQIQRLKQAQQRPQSQCYTTTAHSQNQRQDLIELLLQGQHGQSPMWSGTNKYC